MTTPEPIVTLDPDRIAETLCIGKHNISVTDGLATITFSHIRQEPSILLDEGIMLPQNIVRARIVTSVAHLIDLGKTIDGVLEKVKFLAVDTEGTA